MTRPLSHRQKTKFTARKDPHKKAKPTKAHSTKTTYRRDKSGWMDYFAEVMAGENDGD